jgi:hypothetical protein
MDLQIFYATNRAHEGPRQFQPTSYGALFSNDGMENLRFGRVSFSADDAKVAGRAMAKAYRTTSRSA